MENLRKIREDRNVNQLKVAVDNDISQESISKYETGSSFPSKDILIKLANYFNCSVDYLLGRTEIVGMNNDKSSATDQKIENLIFRYNHLTDENKSKLEGCLLAIEKEQASKEQ